MRKDVPKEARSWEEGDEAVTQLQLGLRRARAVLEDAREELLRATDPWPQCDVRPPRAQP